MYKQYANYLQVTRRLARHFLYLRKRYLLTREEELYREVGVPFRRTHLFSPEQVSVLSFLNLCALGCPALKGIQFSIGELIALTQKLVARYIRTTGCLCHLTEFGSNGLELKAVLLHLRQFVVLTVSVTGCDGFLINCTCHNFVNLEGYT